MSPSLSFDSFFTTTLMASFALGLCDSSAISGAVGSVFTTVSWVRAVFPASSPSREVTSTVHSSPFLVRPAGIALSPFPSPEGFPFTSQAYS